MLKARCHLSSVGNAYHTYLCKFKEYHIGTRIGSDCLLAAIVIMKLFGSLRALNFPPKFNFNNIV